MISLSQFSSSERVLGTRSAAGTARLGCRQEDGVTDHQPRVELLCDGAVRVHEVSTNLSNLLRQEHPWGERQRLLDGDCNVTGRTHSQPLVCYVPSTGQGCVIACKHSL